MVIRPKEIDWEDIIKYTPYITTICTDKIAEINHKDEAISIEDLVQECILHIYNHKDRYDGGRGSVGTFVRIKTRQQLFKMNSRGNTHKNNKEKYIFEKSKELIQLEKDNERV